MSSKQKHRGKKVATTNRKKWTLLVIVFVSLLFRGIYFLQLNDSQALLHMHQWTESDMHLYYEWSEIIQSGDILNKRPYYPYNFWQEQMANYVFNNYSLEVKKLLGTIPPNLSEEERNRLLWEHWIGEKTFFNDPLYPYLIALGSSIYGNAIFWMFVFQILLGAGINVLIYLIAVRYFGGRTGIIAAILAILCAPLMFYNLVLLRTTLITFCRLGIVVLA